MTLPARPTAWSEIMFRQVTSRLRARYFRLGRASTVRTGTTERISSTVVTIPPPDVWESPIAACGVASSLPTCRRLSLIGIMIRSGGAVSRLAR